MFVYRFVLLGVLVNIALCEDIDDDIRVNVHRPKQLPTYSYNHPPLFELSDDYSVLQAKIVRQEKSIEITTPEPSEDNIKKADNISKQVSIGNVKSQRASKNGSEIPVSVIYENNSNEKLKSSSNPTENKIKRRKQRRRPQDNKNNNQSRKSSTETTESFKKENYITTPMPTILQTIKPTVEVSRDVTIFPKRPIEDSNRIKFQKQARARGPVVKILEEKNFVYSHTGNFHYSYDSADGTKVSSRGELLRNENNEGTGEAVVGSVSYKDQEGNDYSLSYTADENGYRPVGAHLPTPPPIPPAIARALLYLATKTPDPVTDAPGKKTKL